MVFYNDFGSVLNSGLDSVTVSQFCITLTFIVQDFDVYITNKGISCVFDGLLRGNPAGMSVRILRRLLNPKPRNS